MIFSAKVFEEEDFDPRDYGYVLTPDVNNTKACFMLKEAEDELVKKSKAAGDTSEVRTICHIHFSMLLCLTDFLFLFFCPGNASNYKSSTISTFTFTIVDSTFAK